MAEDRDSAGGRIPGGPALYAATCAARLGANVTLTTRVPEPRPAWLNIPGVTVRGLPGALPQFVNEYDAAGNRTQFLLAEGDPLPVGAAPATPVDVVIVAPAYRELSGLPGAPARVTGISLQGLFRCRSLNGGRVRPLLRPWPRIERFLGPGMFAFLSVEDTARPESFARRAAALGTTVLVTRGKGGATIFNGSTVRDWPAIPARQKDPTGAGDCFAAAFLVRYAETGSLDAAMRYALAAGACMVEGHGPAAAPTREMVELRLREAA